MHRKNERSVQLVNRRREGVGELVVEIFAAVGSRGP
jgi:hypothetical protein